MRKLEITMIILVLCGTLSILIFWNKIQDKGQTLVLFFTLIAIMFYVRDTHRIANSSAIQSRIYWISNIFVSLSVRIDGFIKDIGTSRLLVENWAEHTTETSSLLEVLLNLWPPTKGKDNLKKVFEECSSHFQNNPLNQEDKKSLINFLLRVKKELQIMVGQLG